MRRYFFDFFDGLYWRKDKCGQEMCNLDDVTAETNEALISLAPKMFARNRNGAISFVVRDDHENNVLKSTLTLENEILGA